MPDSEYHDLYDDREDQGLNNPLEGKVTRLGVRLKRMAAAMKPGNKYVSKSIGL